jgi:hypothetical protein
VLKSCICSYPIKKYPLKDDIIQYVYTGSKHNSPIEKLPQYDKEKYKEMILDAAETVLGFFGFDRTAYSNLNGRRRKWYEELREQRTRDIETEML